MRWVKSHQADPRGALLADRHYSRTTIGATLFMPPGRHLVLVTAAADAVWGSCWQRGDYVAHAWPGAWICTLFRNESPSLSSDLIRDAVAATRHAWGDPPPLGMVTFIDATKIRRKRDPGRCYLRAGFHYAGETQGGLVVVQLLPDQMPAPAPCLNSQLALAW